MSRHANGRPAPCKPAFDSVAAMELRIEEAWLRLTARRGAKPVTVYLTDAGTLTGMSPYLSRDRATEVGTYSYTVTLADFRDDCFFVFEKRRAA